MIADRADMAEPVARERPVGVYVLATLAGAALVLAVVHLLQALGILPYFIGPVAFTNFSLWYAATWGLMIWVWAWAIRALLDLESTAWLFVVFIAGLSVMFDAFTLLATPTQVTDVTISFLVGIAILAYALLPSTKRAFAVR